jgi:DNA-binding FadR family transcriptional regulator
MFDRSQRTSSCLHPPPVARPFLLAGHLRKEIVSGSYAAGMSLPSEGDLAKSLTVSRTVP